MRISLRLFRLKPHFPANTVEILNQDVKTPSFFRDTAANNNTNVFQSLK